MGREEISIDLGGGAPKTPIFYAKNDSNSKFHCLRPLRRPCWMACGHLTLRNVQGSWGHGPVHEYGRTPAFVGPLRSFPEPSDPQPALRALSDPLVILDDLLGPFGGPPRTPSDPLGPLGPLRTPSDPLPRNPSDPLGLITQNKRVVAEDQRGWQLPSRRQP